MIHRLIYLDCTPVDSYTHKIQVVSVTGSGVVTRGI